MSNDVGHIASYNELVTRISSEFARGDMRIKAVTWIAATELEIFRECKPKPADTKKTGTLSSGIDLLTLPRGTTQIHLLQLNISPPLNVLNRSLPEVVQRRDNDRSGIPKFYAWMDNTLELGPATGASTPYTLWYRGLPTELSEDNQNNSIFEFGWDAYFYGSLFHGASSFGGHPNVGTWQAMYEQKKRSLKDLFWDMEASEPLEAFSDYGSLSDSHADF